MYKLNKQENIVKTKEQNILTEMIPEEFYTADWFLIICTKCSKITKKNGIPKKRKLYIYIYDYNRDGNYIKNNLKTSRTEK